MGYSAPFPSPNVEVLEFNTQHRPLDAFHAVVETDFVVIVPLGRAMFAQGPCPGRKDAIICHERSPFTVGAQIFSGIKAEPGDRTEGADDLALIGGPMSLGGILDQGEIMLAA